MSRTLLALSAIVALASPTAAGADYLYSMLQAERQPRVLVLVDNSSTIGAVNLLEIRAELSRLLPRLDGLSVGMARFGDVNGTTCSSNVAGSMPNADRAALQQEISLMSASGLYSLGPSLTAAAAEMARVAKGDKSVSCRPYHVIVITGARTNRCPGSGNTDAEIYSAISRLRNISGGGVKNLDVRTFVIRYGWTLSGEVTTGLEFWDEAARLGGTARSGGEFCKPSAGQRCSSGTALYANNRADLKNALDSILSEILFGEYSAIAPVIGTAPQEDTEVDRVARNFMAYTSFRMPGSEGHLYGIRLFIEESPMAGKWKFTNFYDLDLDNCGSGRDNACVFDAGRKLKEKVGRRQIFTGKPRSPITTADGTSIGGITLPMEPTRLLLSQDSSGYSVFQEAWNSYATLVSSTLSLGVTLPASTVNLGQSTTDGMSDRAAVVDWLQGDPARRPWPLGDIYHAGAAVIGPAGFGYRTRGYPQFAKAVKKRPTMIYVGANDGMIHAFHAAPKLTYQDEIEGSWEAGEEAWAYLPTNMLARASSAILAGENRFFSQDLSCRVDDVLVYDNMSSGVLDCGDDPLCGWRTVLLCGQGWGGSWYVALDVSDPLDPKPLWESTYAGPRGIGRTWSVPGIALLNDRGMPVWAAVTGNGYNADMSCYGGAGCASAETSRLLNLPFNGLFPEHGNGAAGEAGRVFVLNVADGTFIRAIDGPDGAVVADMPIVDSNFDGWSDSTFAGTWKSQLDQIIFTKRSIDFSLDFRHCASVGKFSGSSNKPITSSPAALPSPTVNGLMHVFVGAGVDGGSYPDEQSSSGNQYDFEIFDVKASGCSASVSKLCSSGTKDTTLKSIFSDGHRMVGSPTFVLRKNGERWLTFTSWLPPSVNQPCDESEAILRCLETSDETTCRACGDLDGDGQPDNKTELDTGGRPPTSPTSADGQLYVTTPYGPVRVANQSGEGGGVGGGIADPNQGAPSSALILGWREVFD